MALTTVLKYAGNKRKLMAEIAPHLGGWEGVERYVEPFCGALGSALNAGVPEGVRVVLSDANAEVVNLHLEVARDPAAVEAAANSLPGGEDGYYAVRAWDRAPGWPGNRTLLERAARPLYLNKRGFNGLYRSNRRGEFSTPWGRKDNPGPIAVTSHADFCRFVRERAEINCRDWRSAVRGCGPGDVVYCDPPYVDLKDPRKEFVGYIGSFGWSEQVALRDELEAAAARGARVVVSNSWCDATLELYGGWNHRSVQAERYISCKSEGRKPVMELVAWLP
jgi:DNA adenine methylase